MIEYPGKEHRRKKGFELQLQVTDYPFREAKQLLTSCPQSRAERKECTHVVCLLLLNLQLAFFKQFRARTLSWYTFKGCLATSFNNQDSCPQANLI